MRGRWIIGSLIGLGVAALVTALIFRDPPEPRYQGKPLSYWVDSFNGNLPGLSGPNSRYQSQVPRISEAVRAMDTNAIPFLIKWMQYRPSRLMVRTRALILKAPASVQLTWFGRSVLEMRAEYRADAAAECFQFVRKDAAVIAIPMLVELVNDPLRPAISMRAVTALSYCGREGLLSLVPFLTNSVLSTNASACMPPGLRQFRLPDVPLLASLIKQHDPQALNAVLALGWMHTGAHMAVPVLAEALHHPNANVRGQAANALSYFRLEAVPALPALKEATHDTNKWVADAATKTLEEIERAMP